MRCLIVSRRGLVMSQLYLSRALSSERSNIGNTAILPVVRTASRSHQSFPSFFSPASLSSSRCGQKTTSVRPPSSCIMSTCAFVYSKESTRTTELHPNFLPCSHTMDTHTHLKRNARRNTLAFRNCMRTCRESVFSVLLLFRAAAVFRTS